MNFVYCVSELVQNSLDARAVSIAIRFDFSKRFVQVIDDGDGLADNIIKMIEMNLIFGKQNTEDKCKIMYGFHGRSLANIILRSEKVEILSSQGDNLPSVMIVWKNGLRSKFKRQVCRDSHGTTVTVYSLAYDRLEPIEDRINDFRRILKPIKEIALINPLVSFTTLNIKSDEIVLAVPKTNTVLSRFENNFGTQYSKHLKRIHYKENNFQINGLISQKAISSTKDLQFFYVNKHFLGHYNKIYEYVESVYQKYVVFGNGKWPVYIIDLKCPINYNKIDCDQLVTSVSMQKLIDLAFKSYFKRAVNKDGISGPVEANLKEKKIFTCKDFDLKQIRGVIYSNMAEKEIKSLIAVQTGEKKQIPIRNDILKKIEILEHLPKTMPEYIMEKFLKSVIIIQKFGENELMLGDDSSSNDSSAESDNEPIKSHRNYNEEDAIFQEHLEKIINKRNCGKENDVENKLPSVKSEENTALKIDVAVETNKAETVVMQKLEASLKISHESDENSLESPPMFEPKPRCFYLPKGMSQAVLEKEKIPEIQSLSFESRNKLHEAMFSNYPFKKSYDFMQYYEEAYKISGDMPFDVNNITAKVQSKTGKSLLRNLNSVTFSKELFNNCKFIGQIDNKFLATVCKVNKSELIVFFDQHAVHERIRLENLLEEFQTNENGHLLKSTRVEEIQLELNEIVIERVKKIQQQLLRIGFRFDIEKGVILIRDVPMCLMKQIKNLEKQFCEIVDEIEQHLRISKELHSIPKYLHNVISSMACRGAIKFGDCLSNIECENMLEQLSKCAMPFQCAHGRPSLMPIFDMNAIN